MNNRIENVSEKLIQLVTDLYDQSEIVERFEDPNGVIDFPNSAMIVIYNTDEMTAYNKIAEEAGKIGIPESYLPFHLQIFNYENSILIRVN